MRPDLILRTTVVLAAAVMITPAQAAVRHCTASSADEQRIRQTIRAFYEAERTGDIRHWRELTTGDFYMFHEGVITPPDAFVGWIAHQRQGLRRDPAATWSLDVSDLRISIDCTTALATLVLHNVSTAPTLKPGSRYDETFLESFWLRKEVGKGWRIAFWNAAMQPHETPSWAIDRAAPEEPVPNDAPPPIGSTTLAPPPTPH